MARGGCSPIALSVWLDIEKLSFIGNGQHLKTQAQINSRHSVSSRIERMEVYYE